MINQTNSQRDKGISRRAFLSRAGAGSALLAFGLATTLRADDLTKVLPWKEGSTAYKFHMIGNAHIDPVWLWPWSVGISVVYSTFKSALVG